MRFKPKTQEELEAEDLLPKGEYDATVLEAEETTSKTTGKPMFKVKLGVYDQRGRQEWVFDYILADSYKLPAIAKACKLFDRYQEGELTAEELLGRDLRVKIGIEEGKDGFRAKNKALDYVYEKVEAVKTSPPAPKPQPKDDAPEDDIPF